MPATVSRSSVWARCATRRGTPPGEYSVVYRVADQYGESATARVTFVVVPEDRENNQPPVPLPQTARVFSGATIPIELPLDGIDPDGDSVVIVGLERNGALGVATVTSPTTISYTADRASGGTDTIAYVVEDAFGSQSVGILSIGVIPPPDSAQPPNAVDDGIEMEPGRTASVAVLLNDSDPSGFSISLNEDLLEVDPGIEASTDGSKIIVEAPETEGTFSIRYRISNGHGGSDDAFLQVAGDPRRRPGLPDRARRVRADRRRQGRRLRAGRARGTDRQPGRPRRRTGDHARGSGCRPRRRRRRDADRDRDAGGAAHGDRLPGDEPRRRTVGNRVHRRAPRRQRGLRAATPTAR